MLPHKRRLENGFLRLRPVTVTKLCSRKKNIDYDIYIVILSRAKSCQNGQKHLDEIPGTLIHSAAKTGLLDPFNCPFLEGHASFCLPQKTPLGSSCHTPPQVPLHCPGGLHHTIRPIRDHNLSTGPGIPRLIALLRNRVPFDQQVPQ